MKRLLLRLYSSIASGIMVFEDDSVIDYMIRNTTLRYQTASHPILSCEFPLAFNEATGELRIDFKELSRLNWDKPLVRPFTEVERTDLRKKIERFVEKQGRPFVTVRSDTVH